MDDSQPTENGNESTLIKQVWSWRVPLISSGLIGAIVSAAASFLIEPEFQSSVVLFALPQQSIGAQFYEEVKREDILEYGETEDAERLLQILNSDRIRRRIIEKYDLWSHYEIERDQPGAKAAMAKVYAGKVGADLTRYGSIRIDVFDTAPEMARDIANDIAQLTDSVANQLRNDRALEAFRYAERSLRQNQREMEEMERRLGDLRKEGVYDYPIQIEGLNEQYATALAEGQKSRANDIMSKMERLAPFANEYNQLTTKLEDAYEQEAVLKKRFDLNKLDSESQLPAAFVVDRASVADKKARPVRWLITVMGALSVALASMVFLLTRQALQ
jgi:LPS O-antigen subunit length determinant protein (WzzB/FepE family)